MSLKCGCSQKAEGATTNPDAYDYMGSEMETNVKANTDACPSLQRQACAPGLKCKYEPVGCACKAPNHPSQVCCCTRVNKSGVCIPPKPVTPPRDICRCGKSPLKELENEKELRMRMESEIQKLKIQIANVMQSKSMALNMTKQLKQRYERMKSKHDDTSSKLESVSRENEYLCRCLQKEKLQNQQSFTSKDESGIQVMNKEIDKSAIKTITEQSKKIKSLNDSVQNLSQTVEDKDFEKKKLEHEKNKIHESLKKTKDITKKLSETNAKLASSVRKKHDSLMAIRDKADKYHKELKDYKHEAMRSQQELEKLKGQMEKHKNKGDALSQEHSQYPPPKEKDVNTLESKLKKMKDRERRSSEAMQVLSQKIRDFESVDIKGQQREMLRLNKDLTALQSKYDEAMKKLQLCENADKNKSDLAAAQMKNLSENLGAKEVKFAEDRNNLEKLIAELQATVDDQKSKITELEDLKQQQDIVIKTQNEQLESKEEQIKLGEQESDLVKEQCLDLDKKVDDLRSSIDQFEQIGSKISTGSEVKKINNLQTTLDEEQQKSKMKDQVIEDQNKKIQELEKLLADRRNEISKLSNLSRQASMKEKASKDKLDQVSRQLAYEKSFSRQTVSDLESMTKQKKKLQKNVEDLEETCQEISSITMSQQFEKQATDWTEEKKKLIAERDRAINAAKLATHTLIETMNDFQGQIKSQQKLQKIVTDMLSCQRGNIPPCVQHELKKNMQTTIPCRPAMPACNLRYQFQQNDEDGFYTASSGKSSTNPSDSDDTSPAGLTSQHMSFTYPVPSTTSSIRPCRCVNPRCSCPKSTIPLVGSRRSCKHATFASCPPRP